MVAKKTGLGKGLDNLIPAKAPKEKQIVNKNGEIVLIMNIAKVEPDRDQPRKNFDEDALLELSESVKLFGILEPIIVQDKKTYYKIVAGERRWRAAKMAGLKEVPIIVKDYTDKEVVEIQLIENVQREDLNAIEEAQGYKKLMTEFNLKQDEVAERVSKSRTAVTNAMRLLKLDERVQKMVIDEMINAGHARALLGIDDPEKQYLTAQKVFDEKLNVRETEKLVKNMQQTKKEKKDEDKLDPQLEAVYRNLEEQMKGILGTKVVIHSKNAQSGKLEIDYYSADELDRIIDLFRTIK